MKIKNDLKIIVCEGHYGTDVMAFRDYKNAQRVYKRMLEELEPEYFSIELYSPSAVDEEEGFNVDQYANETIEELK